MAYLISNIAVDFVSQIYLEVPVDRLKKLAQMNSYAADRITNGLSDEDIQAFLEQSEALGQAIDRAYDRHLALRDRWGDLLALSESEQITKLQEDYVNFYAQDAINPYVPLAAQGPWIVTSCGAVVHDSGGYGMLGMGHGASALVDALSEPMPMANIMTASLWQKRFAKMLRREIGHTRKGCPYSKFFCLNSGSEAMTLAARLSDLKAMAKQKSDNPPKKIKLLSLKGGFHGRTDRPSQASDSCLKTYQAKLASFYQRDNLLTVTINDVDELRQVFADAQVAGEHIEAFLMEPVMGEGNPGVAVSLDFYREARRLTREMGSLLVVDSIQAGYRAFGCLSIVDYPGFDQEDAPDIESFSKALNGGQFPLSVLAVSYDVASSYGTGLYGNTMTSNPRALAVACAVLEGMTPELRQNIKDRGKEFLIKLKDLAGEFDMIQGVQGSGLLFAISIDQNKAPVVGPEGLEDACRRAGIGVIHGGVNSLRFTPVFAISSSEIDLIIRCLRSVFRRYTK